MKKLSILILILLSIITVVGCDFSTTNNITTSTLSSSSTITESSTIVTTENSSQSTTESSLELTTITTDEFTTTTNTTEDINNLVNINLYSMNDFHGGTYSDIYNLEYIGGYLKYREDNYNNTILLTDGDMLQGTALSNYYHGRPIIEVLNYVGFDGYVLGNHEFDWGIEEILKYRDGESENGELNHPILAANIRYIDTQLPLENTIPYITKEIDGVKVGIIGVIGNVINSIAASRTVNIEFTDPADAIYEYTEELRVNQDCDIVVVYIHEGSNIDSSIAYFTGNHFVDGIFNGHTHASEVGSISRSNGLSLIYAQSSNRDNSLFTEISFVYDKELESVVTASGNSFKLIDITSYSDEVIVNILDTYNNDLEYVTFVSEILTEAEYQFYRNDLAPWGATVIKDYLNIDVGALNSGGFRRPMSSGALTMGKMIEIYPFDNYIKTAKLTGAELLSFYQRVRNQSYDVIFDNDLTYDGTNLFINGVLVESDTLYTVGAVDYIFDKTYYDFMYGEDVTLTSFLMRDLLVEDLRNSNNLFNPDNGSNYQDLSFAYSPSYYEELKKTLYI